MGVVKLSTAGIVNYQKYDDFLAGNAAYEPPGNAYEWLETVTLGTATPTVVFSNLDTNYGSTYQHLQIRMVSRGTRASNADSNIYVQFNSDTAANYNSHYLRGNGSVIESGDYSSTNNNGVFLYQGNTGATQTTNSFSANIIDILDPFETTKYTTVRNFGGMTSALNRVFIHSGAWRNTAAVTTITLDDTLGNFDIYSRFSLYGLRSA